MIVILLAVVVVVVICCGLNMLRGGGSQEAGDVAFQQPVQSTQPAKVEPTRPPATATPKPFTPPAATAGDGDTWLVMLYQDADDKVLEKDIYLDLNEAERIGSTDNVHIVSQLDRYRRGYKGDGNWDSTKRFYVTYDPDLNRVQSQEIADLGEVNMADGDSLVDFVTWAIDTFPADKHVLILSDHGMGWPGGWTDPDPGVRGDHNIPLAQNGDQMFLMEMDQALGEIRDRTGLDKFEIVGLDACLMAHVEVYEALAPHARYAVASQETEPALGWAYTGFLDALVRNPGMSGADLSRLIVQSYIQDDQRIVDEQARADLLRGSRGSGFGLPSAAQVAQQMADGTTLSAVDLAAMPNVIASLNNLASTLQESDQRSVAQARNYAQSFTSVFGRGSPPSYIDLGNFAQMLKRETRSSAITQAADQLLAALDQSVIAERHGRKKPGSTGMSIYFPNSKLFRHPAAGPQSYTTVANRFAANSLWDDFLTYHYTGRQFDSTTGAISVPETGKPVMAPGAGGISVGPIQLSSSTVAVGDSITVSTDVAGENLGYILFFTGYLDETAKSIFVADMDYLESAETREVDGVYYPEWGEGEFELEFEWEPLMFGIDDGQGAELALFSPNTYGSAPENAIYTVDGMYDFTDGESRNARMYFSDGEYQQVFSFQEDGASGAPSEIVPVPGDRFVVLEQWMDMDANGQVSGIATQEGGTVAFGDQVLEWVDLDAAPGQYIIGFIVQDLDGNSYPVYEKVTVR